MKGLYHHGRQLETELWQEPVKPYPFHSGRIIPLHHPSQQDVPAFVLGKVNLNLRWHVYSRTPTSSNKYELFKVRRPVVSMADVRSVLPWLSVPEILSNNSRVALRYFCQQQNNLIFTYFWRHHRQTVTYHVLHVVHLSLHILTESNLCRCSIIITQVIMKIGQDIV